MKNTVSFKLTLPALALVLSVANAHADIPVHGGKVNIYGYVAGSASQVWQGCLHGEPDTSVSGADMNAAKLGASFDQSPVGARLSVYIPGDSAGEDVKVRLLEANVTYNISRNFNVTAGRFQSWIGYEAFDIPSRHFITLATTGRLNIIPSFHEGIKFENRIGKCTYGIALLDSIYGTARDPYSGDGSLADGYGIEGRAKYAKGNFTGVISAAYQSDRENNSTDTWVVDLHGEYEIRSTKTTLGGEFCYKTAEPLAYASNGRAMANNRVNTCFGLLMLRQSMSKKNTLFLRLSMGHDKAAVYKDQSRYDDGSSVYHGGTTTLYTKFSMAFNHEMNKWLDFRGEAAYTDYTNSRQGSGQIAKESFLGMQMVLKF